MGKDYSENQEILETLNRIVKSGSPLQHSAVGQMTKIVREEAIARDREKYEPKEKEKIHQPRIREGNFFLQTQSGKFLYACLGKESNVIILPTATMPLAKLSQIVREMIADYRPIEPEDHNYLYMPDLRTDVEPTPENFAKWQGDDLVLISKEPIRSDITYQGNGAPNWGRVEIVVRDGSGSIHGMDVVTPFGEYIDYCIPWECLAINCSTYDLSWDGSPDKNKEFHSNKGKYGTRTYAVVKNKEECRRLVPQFWQIIKRLIGDDKIVAISDKPGGMLPLTLGEAKRKYDVRPVVKQKYMVFEGPNPQLWNHEGRRFPTYYFPMSNGEFGLLIDRSDSAYMIPYLFFRTKWYEEGIDIESLETILEN